MTLLHAISEDQVSLASLSDDLSLPMFLPGCDTDLRHKIAKDQVSLEGRVCEQSTMYDLGASSSTAPSVKIKMGSPSVYCTRPRMDQKVQTLTNNVCEFSRHCHRPLTRQTCEAVGRRVGCICQMYALRHTVTCPSRIL